MGRTVGIGYQDFEQLILSGCFYVDKTRLIKEWWESGYLNDKEKLFFHQISA